MLTTPSPRQSDDYYCQSQWQSISLHDRSTVYRSNASIPQPALLSSCSRLQSSHPAMTITDSIHQPLASVRHFVSHKESCMTSHHSILPIPLRHVSSHWYEPPPSPLSVTSSMDDAFRALAHVDDCRFAHICLQYRINDTVTL